jgi:acyl-CoA synthetase (AMP-forming)/AMP-acid ligase II
VREVTVFGVEDARWGETPVAAVILHVESVVAPAELAEWINARVGAKFQRVSDVLILEEFPRTIAGKTLKRVLQEQYRKG